MQASDKSEFDRLFLAEKRRLGELPYFEQDPGCPDSGVLLSDRIRHYCRPRFKLISPFKISCLRPAGYDLRVGSNYAKGGGHYTLADGGSFTIEPYQVAIIQTLETLNLPAFLIGRWNIRVGLAYDGLLWVGGAQVDPGFRGRLSCPIYNLSTKAITLKYGQSLAMIDFVTTTPVNIRSKPFRWWTGKKLIFQEYSIGLESGVAERLKDIDDKVAKRLKGAMKKTSIRFENAQTRMDTFMTLSFTVVAVLFAGLGVIATKGSDEPSFVSSPVWVAAVALYFALRPSVVVFEQNLRTRNNVQQNPPVPPAHVRARPVESRFASLVPRPLEFLIAGLITVGSLGFHIYHAHVSAKEIQQAKDQASRALSSVEEQKKLIETEARIRQQYEVKMETLTEKVNRLSQKP
jgi:deoxycytidine triphosphate deaminase